MKKAISQFEMMLRQKAVDFANASVRLEGFEPTQQALQRGETFVNGEIDLEELTQARIGAQGCPNGDQ
jgi:hypothetical protein